MGRRDGSLGQQMRQCVVAVFIHTETLPAAGPEDVQQVIGGFVLFGSGLGGFLCFKVEDVIGYGAQPPGRQGAIERLEFAEQLRPPVGVQDRFAAGVERPLGGRFLPDGDPGVRCQIETCHHVPEPVLAPPGIPLDGVGVYPIRLQPVGDHVAELGGVLPEG